MEFMCVLSVSGSLANYLVQKESETNYQATLRTVNGEQTDLPPEIRLLKAGNEWSGTPHHEEIFRGLVNAIEAAEDSDDKPESNAS